MASILSSERGGPFDIAYCFQPDGTRVPIPGIGRITSGPLGEEGIFKHRGYRPGGVGLLLDEVDELSGVIQGRMVSPITDGNRADNYTTRETGVTQTCLGSSSLSDQTYHIRFKGPVVSKHFSSIETAQEVATIYRICALAGLNPPAVFGIYGPTVNFERIDGSNLINFFTSIESSGLIHDSVARKLIDALTNKSLSETVKFQYSDVLPRPVRARDYVNDLIGSYFALLHWSSGLGNSDIIEAGREFLKSRGIDEAILRTELSAIGGKLKSAASDLKFRYRDGELANNMLDIDIINARLAELRMGEVHEPIEILHRALKGRLTEMESMQILCDSVRPVDLDGLVSASAGIDDFFRAVTATNTIHPLMHEKGYLDGKLSLYLQYIASFTRNPKEAEEMKQRGIEYGNEAIFFTHIRRGSAVHLKKFQKTMVELLLGDSVPDSPLFNRLVEDAVNLQYLIGYNLREAHSYLLEGIKEDKNKKEGEKKTELEKLAYYFANMITVPVGMAIKHLVLEERARRKWALRL